MAIKVNWDDTEKTTLYYSFSGDWLWNDLHVAVRRGRAMMASVNHRVGSIFDLRGCDSLPGNALVHLQLLCETQPPNAGLTVVVTNSRYVYTLFYNAIQMDEYIGQYFRLAPQLNDAHVTLLVNRVVA